MARPASEKDFPVDVEGIGTFIFGRRKLKDEIKIQVEYAKFIEGAEPTQWLELVAGWIAALNVMTVKAPDGWDIDGMDPLDNDTYAKLGRVHKALTDKERSFRSGASQAGQTAG